MVEFPVFLKKASINIDDRGLSILFLFVKSGLQESHITPVDCTISYYLASFCGSFFFLALDCTRKLVVRTVPPRACSSSVKRGSVRRETRSSKLCRVIQFYGLTPRSGAGTVRKRKISGSGTGRQSKL